VGRPAGGARSLSFAEFDKFLEGVKRRAESLGRRLV
jgi:hypothetical protein